MPKEIFQIHTNKDSPFIVGEHQTYKMVPLGYIDKNGNTVFDPLDIEKVKVTKKGELEDGSVVLIARSTCKCAVNIEVFDKE
ncbi:MAG TPA: hypothetical protein VGO63_02085 [Candidatus Paceibacterota bacterium]|jgi:hypothetical protein|nr:hypothetical protein [Candidatus Paceibacterota bacterium]